MNRQAKLRQMEEQIREKSLSGSRDMQQKLAAFCLANTSKIEDPSLPLSIVVVILMVIVLVIVVVTVIVIVIVLVMIFVIANRPPFLPGSRRPTASAAARSAAVRLAARPCHYYYYYYYYYYCDHHCYHVHCHYCYITRVSAFRGPRPSNRDGTSALAGVFFLFQSI